MNKLFVLCISTMISLACAAQSKVEQYCEVVATQKILSKKVTIDIDYGELRSIWKDNRLKDEDGKLKSFNTVIDALNYFGKNGWKLVNAFPVNEGNVGNVYHYVFKKEFDISETAGTN